MTPDTPEKRLSDFDADPVSEKPWPMPPSQSYAGRFGGGRFGGENDHLLPWMAGDSPNEWPPRRDDLGGGTYLPLLNAEEKPPSVWQRVRRYLFGVEHG